MNDQAASGTSRTSVIVIAGGVAAWSVTTATFATTSPIAMLVVAALLVTYREPSRLPHTLTTRDRGRHL